MKYLKLLIFSSFLFSNYQNLYSQITSSDGLRLSGDFSNSGWTNTHGQGGPLDMSIRADNVGSKTVWKTSAFNERAMNYSFKFASGSGNPWANTWCGFGAIIDQVATAIYNDPNNAGLSGIFSDTWLFANWEDNGYANTQICFLALGANATGISSIIEGAPPNVNLSSVDF